MTAWPIKRLAEIATIERDLLPPERILTGMPYIGLEQIESGGNLINVNPIKNGELKSTKFKFTSIHILYGKLRPYLAKISAPNFSGICSTEIVPIRPHSGIDRQYLLHFLRQPEQVELATARSAGANLPRLSPNELAKFEIPVPPLPEQRRIAAILDQADALRAKRRAALAQLDEMAQAIFVEMFGTSGASDSETVTSFLADVVQNDTIVTYGIVQAGEEFPGGVPYIRTGDLVNGAIRLEGLRHTDPKLAAKFTRSRVRSGDIVMSIRATVGTTALVPKSLNGANLTQGTARIAPGSKVDRLYLLSFLRSDATQRWIERQVKGATFREITLARLRELPVAIPPRKLQSEFSKRLHCLENLQKISQTALYQLDSLFASLQHRAFRGEL